jgi:uncharacterized protein YabE (DUF348 family)
MPLLALLLAGYSAAGAPITLIVNGQTWHWYTHQTTVQGLLREVNITLHSQDVVVPSFGAPLTGGSEVDVELARPVTVEVDGRELASLTRKQLLGDILGEAGVFLKPGDDLLVDGQARPWDWPVGAPDPGANRGLARWPEECQRPAPLRVVVHRSVPVVLVDGGAPVTFYTTRPTVGEALLSQGVFLYLGDRVSPGLGNRVVPGLHIYVQRSTPVTLQVDGATLRTRTQRRTVSELLAQEGISLMGKDFALPPLDALISQDMTVQVVRVQEAIKIEQETIPYETNWVATSDMPIDTQQVVQPGSEGVTKRRYRATNENGTQVANVLEDQWLDSTPSTRVIAYGTHITAQTLESPDGPMEYWRRFRVLATAYSAATSGKSPDDPQYGVTRLGLKAGVGIIAVDPKVIPIGSWVYVPGYGKAIAGDTGSSILGRHIDLGFPDDQPLPYWYQWVDVYLLTPAPPRDDVRYVLPNWPQER